MSLARRSMGDTDIAERLESFLRDKGLRYCRKEAGKRFRPLFIVMMDVREGDVTELRVNILIRDREMVFEATSPLTVADRNMLAKLVNDLNLSHPVGTFQMDEHDGELNWTHYLWLKDDRWPGDDRIDAMLTMANGLAVLLCRELPVYCEAQNGKESV